ncbi:MAG: helix-turn-helix domain-containing protein, partial [Bacillota bacterium]|nr:helix-turn-helix domain-containing protein [Bacillota bacterium]
MVIGLEYILDLYSMTGTELADDLKIKKQNISRWFKGVRKIPVKYLDILEDKFKIPKEYITKNVRESDKLIIQKYKIENEDNEKKQLYQLEYDIK